METIGLMKKWRGLFGTTAVVLREDIKSIGKVNYGLTYELEQLIETNNTMMYGMFFTPQGNLGKKQKMGEKNLVKDSDAEKYISCFFVDIDIRHSDFIGHEDSLEYVKKIILERSLPVSYIVKSGGGWHLYMFIEEDIRENKLLIKNYKAFQKEFANMFGPLGDETCVNIARLMRMPFSFHWKTYNPIMVDLYSVERTGEGLLLELIRSEEQILPPIATFSLEHIEAMAANLIVHDMGAGNSLSIAMRGDMNVVNKIDFDKVFFKLTAFPKDLGEELLTYHLNGMFIDIHYTNKTTGEVRIVHTDGYRYNKKGNYVNNFSRSQHSIEDRPIGGVYSFLYHYFGKDSSMVRMFLKEAFFLDLGDESRVARNLMTPMVTQSGTMFFTEKNVIHRGEKVFPNGKIVQNELILINIPIRILGRMESRFMMKGEGKESIYYYLIERGDRFYDRESLIQFVSSRTRFNDMYGPRGIIFTAKGEDSLVIEFYDAINHAHEAGQIPNYELEFLNGWHDNYFIVGDNIILPDFKIVKKYDCVYLQTQQIDLSIDGKEQISISDFYKKLGELFSNKICILSLLGYITAFLGVGFWKTLLRGKQSLMIPALIVSGKTRVGKSTLLTLLKEGSGISANSRKLSIRSTTLQPLRQALTDSFLLHIEEYTGEINEEKESLIRDAINQANSGRGLASGENIVYNYRAGLLIDGERLPKSESVVNRCIVCPMYERDKKGSPRMLGAMKSYSFLKNLIVQGYAMSEDDVNNAYLEAVDNLQSKGLSGRQNELYSFLLAVNTMFSITDHKTVLDVIMESAELENVSVKSDELSSLLSFIIIIKKIMPRYGQLVDCEGYRLEVPLTDEIMREKEIDIKSVLETYPNNITFEHNTLIFYVPTANIEFGKKVSPFYQYSR